MQPPSYTPLHLPPIPPKRATLSQDISVWYKRLPLVSQILIPVFLFVALIAFGSIAQREEALKKRATQVSAATNTPTETLAQTAARFRRKSKQEDAKRALEYKQQQARDKEMKAERRKIEAEIVRRAEEESDSDGLVLLLKTVHGTTGEYTGEITGTIENRRDNTLSYAQITFNLYDRSGAQIGTALANINGLEAGGKWKFKAVALESRFHTYKFSELSGF